MGCSSSALVNETVTSSVQLKNSPDVKRFDEIVVEPTIMAPPLLCPLLTDDQKVIIRNTWTLMNEGESDHSNAVILGKKIFLRIFEVTPDVKQLFPFKAAWGDELLSHPHFQAHSARFMQIIIGAVDNLDYLDSDFSETIYILGKAHAYKKGFQQQFFDTFLSAIFFIWKQELRGDFTDETEKSWCILFEFIINRLKEGYDYEMESTGKSQNGNAKNDTTS